MFAVVKLKSNLFGGRGNLKIQYVTKGGGARPKRYVSLHRGKRVKIDWNQRYVNFGWPLKSFLFLHEDRGKLFATSGLGVQYQKKRIQGLEGDKCQKLGNATIILFHSLHDDKDQHCATIKCQKIGFLTCSPKLQQIFFPLWMRSKLQHLA